MLNQSQAEWGFYTGAQAGLIIAEAPAGQEALVGQPLLGKRLQTAGVYYIDVLVAGLKSMAVQLKATIAMGTVTSDVYTTYLDGTTKKNAFTGVGALADGVVQQTTYATLLGERVVRIKLTLVDAADTPGVPPDPDTPNPVDATFTLAEYNGLRS